MDLLCRIGFRWLNILRLFLREQFAYPQFVILLVLALVTSASPLAGQPLPEYKIKAALLYKFAKFITWPDSAFDGADEQLGICVIGENPFGSFLDILIGRQVQGRNVVVKHFQNTADFGSDCHIAYIGAREKETLKKNLKSLQHQSILTVSDADKFAYFGGIIAMILKNKKIGFEINRGSARQAGIRISSQLLSLATIVETEAN